MIDTYNATSYPFLAERFMRRYLLCCSQQREGGWWRQGLTWIKRVWYGEHFSLISFFPLPFPEDAVPPVISRIQHVLSEFSSYSTYGNITEEEMPDRLQKTRLLRHALRKMFQTEKRGTARRQYTSAYLRAGLGLLLYRYDLLKYESPCSHRRLLRLIINEIFLCAEDLYSCAEVCEGIKQKKACYSEQDHALTLKEYSDLLSWSFKLGLPKLWRPLHYTLKTQSGDLLKYPTPLRKEAPRFSLFKNARPALFMTEDSIQPFHVAGFIHQTPFMSLSTHLRSLRLIEQSFPGYMSALGVHSREDTPESERIHKSLLGPLRKASSPALYHAWCNAWKQKGFSLRPLLLWNGSIRRHRVPSAYACAHQALLYDKDAPRVIVILRGDVAPFFQEAAFQEGGASPLSSTFPPEGSQDSYVPKRLVLADYVLPLLCEGEHFLKEACLEWNTIGDLPPRFLKTQKEKGDVLSYSPCVTWSPWQHIAAYLVLGHDTLFAHPDILLPARLSLFERHWGPPRLCTGDIEGFNHWYAPLRAHRVETEHGPSDEWKGALLIWERYLEEHVYRYRESLVLRTVLEEPVSLSERGSSAQETTLSPCKDIPPVRRRV